MTIPPLLSDLLALLFDLAAPAAVCTMVLAGIALRQEGGVNFQAGGRFQRWVLWSVMVLSLPQLLCWLWCLLALWNYLTGTILPAAAGLAVVGAIINYARQKPVLPLVYSALAFLSGSGLWRLVQAMVG